jgi:16S rRNA (guanine(966)-N(2))-methyltransferase RsmD
VNRIRIIGGRWRSRLIEIPRVRVPGLRPTPDRVRETLFNWLGQTLDGLDCLDLFAGSGILGFEAASRDASMVTLIERDAHAHAALRRNAGALGATQIEIMRADALEFLASASRQFDVAFVDPPYRQGWIERIMPLLDHALRPGGQVYVEAETPLTQIAGWRALKQGRAGQVHFHLLTRAEETT